MILFRRQRQFILFFFFFLSGQDRSRRVFFIPQGILKTVLKTTHHALSLYAGSKLQQTQRSEILMAFLRPYPCRANRSASVWAKCVQRSCAPGCGSWSIRNYYRPLKPDFYVYPATRTEVTCDHVIVFSELLIKLQIIAAVFSKLQLSLQNPCELFVNFILRVSFFVE